MNVPRFEHRTAGSYRDVEVAGLHLDVHNPEKEQVAKLTHWPPEPSNTAMGRAERYLRQNAEELVERFESWL